MQGIFSTLAATLALFLSASVAGATTYTIQSQLGSAGHIWFPEFTLSNIINDVAVRLVIVTNASLGPVHTQSLIDFQVDGNEFRSLNHWQSDLLAPTLRESVSPLADETTIFATTMGLFSDFESEVSFHKKFKPESAEKLDAFSCSKGVGTDCQVDAKYDAADAILFSSKLDWGVFIVGSNCCSTEVWKWLLIEQLLSGSNFRFQRENVSSPRIVILRTTNRF
jgi:hypothetical protein